MRRALAVLFNSRARSGAPEAPRLPRSWVSPPPHAFSALAGKKAEERGVKTRRLIPRPQKLAFSGGEAGEPRSLKQTLKKKNRNLGSISPKGNTRDNGICHCEQVLLRTSVGINTYSMHKNK